MMITMTYQSLDLIFKQAKVEGLNGQFIGTSLLEISKLLQRETSSLNGKF